MERNFLVCPSFVKLLMDDDFVKEIRIPNAFIRDFKNKLTRKCVLRGTTAKKSWPVRICRKDNNFYIRKRAWPNFVKYHKLKCGDYLLFWLVKKTTFVVIPYGANCNRKSVVSYYEESDSSSSSDDEFDSLEEDDINEMDEDGDDDEDDVDEDDDLDPSKGQSSKNANYKKRTRVKEESEKEREETVDARDGYYQTNLKNPYFIKEVKTSHRSIMVIPSPFAKETKLDSKEIFFLHGEDDRKWPVKIWTHPGTSRFGIGEGWSRFRKVYKVKVGDTCKFTLVKSLGNVFSVEIMRPQ